MQVTITLGLEELKLLPEELRQKIQSSLGLPVVTQQQMAQAYVQQTVQEILQQPVVTAVPQTLQQAMPAFAPPTQLQTVLPNAMPHVAPPQSMPAPPAKQPVIQNGVPTFMPSKDGLDQQSVAVDVMTNNPVTPATPPSAPVVPQFNQAPLTVAPVTTGVAAMAPMGPAVDAATVRAAAIRAHNSLTNGKQIVAAAQAASGVSIANLTNENAPLLAHHLRNQGVNV